MKKYILLFAITFAFVLGTNTVNAQKINKKEIQDITIEILDEYSVVPEVRILKETLYWRVKTAKGKNFLLVSTLEDYNNRDFTNIETIEQKKLSLLGNYIKMYLINKKQNVVVMN